MKATLKPYPSYKNADLPWLETIPSEWKVQRLKYLFRERDERSPRGEERLLSLRMNEGLVDHLDVGGTPVLPDALVGYKRVRPGQVIMNRMRATTGLFAVATLPGIVSPDYAVFDPKPGVDVSYFVRLFKTPGMAGVFKFESKGLGTGEAGFLRLYTDRFGRIPVPIPGAEEQATIVRFLDNADWRIRRYIRAKRRLIALLNEQKQAIISRMVTRGLDPNASLKSSVVGEVADAWSVLALKRVLRKLIDCEHKTAPATDASDYRVVRTTAVRSGRLRLTGTYCTTREAFQEWTRRGLPEAGDVIFTREAPAGEACLVPAEHRVCLGQRTVLMKVNPDKYDPEFLISMIYAGPPADRIRLASQGSTVGHFNIDDIADMKVLVPSLSEQRAIVTAVKGETESLELAMERAEQELDLFREYRARLIADVVTGKLDVREVAAQLPDAPAEPEAPEDAVAAAEAEDTMQDEGLVAAAAEPADDD
jgi:type I restriction enzyme S subunit